MNFNKQDEVSKTSISPVSVCDLKHSRDQAGITDLEGLHKERHQPMFRLAWNWPHNLCSSTSWPLYFMNKYRETMQYLVVNALNVSTTQKEMLYQSESMSQTNDHMTEVTIQHLN